MCFQSRYPSLNTPSNIVSLKWWHILQYTAWFFMLYSRKGSFVYHLEAKFLDLPCFVVRGNSHKWGWAGGSSSVDKWVGELHFWRMLRWGAGGRERWCCGLLVISWLVCTVVVIIIECSFRLYSWFFKIFNQRYLFRHACLVRVQY